jgi:hypothetical protein
MSAHASGVAESVAEGAIEKPLDTRDGGTNFRVTTTLVDPPEQALAEVPASGALFMYIPAITGLPATASGG